MMRKKWGAVVFVIFVVFAVGVGITQSFFSANSTIDQAQPTLQLLDTAKLTNMIKNNEDMVIVDLREPELFATGRVPTAINIPFAEINKRYTGLPKEKKIVFICHTGRMGTESGQLLLDNGYKEVFNLEGGMAKWTGKLEK